MKTSEERISDMSTKNQGNEEEKVTKEDKAMEVVNLLSVGHRNHSILAETIDWEVKGTRSWYRDRGGLNMRS